MKALALLVCLSVVFGLEVSLTKLQSEPIEQKEGALFVRVSFTNDGDEPVYILKWNTVLDDLNPLFRSDSFELVHDTCGAVGVYKGIALKRVANTSTDDFVLVPAKQTLFFDIDLLQGYWLPEVGSFSLALRDQVFWYHTSEDKLTGSMDELKSVDVEVNAITAEVSSVSAPPVFSGEEPGLLGAVSIKNCNAALETAIKNVHNDAITEVNMVQTYMTGSGSQTKIIYVEWFGTYDSGRWSTVQSHFSNIRKKFDSGYWVDCAGSSCSAGVYAYVYPSDTTFTVYVCSGFTNASANKCVADSKPGTIIHELSHFTSVAATKDNAYGQAKCRDLAKTNPAQAVANADNHEYMSEACPT